MHQHAQPPALTSRRPDLPPSVDHVIAKALAKDPAHRHASAGELARDLAAALAPLHAAGPHAPALVARTAGQSRSPWWAPAIAAGIALLVVAVGAGALALRGEDEAPAGEVADAAPDATAAPTTGPASLLDQVPVEFRDTCAAVEGILPSGAQEAVRCMDDGLVVEVTYTRFDSQESMDAAYAEQIQGRIETDTGPGCGEAAPSETSYDEVDVVDAGRLACYDQDGAGTIIWTHDVSRILSVAVDEVPYSPALYGFWFVAGPL
jgi:serine/threonine-protein kinase